MSESKISKRILFIIGAVLCCIFAVILVCNLTIIIKGVANPRIPPSVFGVTPMVVQSGSMSGNAEDHIEVGDLIFTVNPDTDKLKAGDIISFMDGNIAVTHRIIVFGLYKGRVPGLGDFAMFLQKPLGMAVFIGIPVCAFIICDIVRRQRSSGKRDKETEELKAELERLPAAAGEKNPEKEDGGNT